MENKPKTPQIEILLAEAQDIGYGQNRKRLQDTCAALKITTASGKELSIGLVADGVGGASAGHVASQIVIEVVVKSIQEATENDIDIILENSLLAAQQAVREQAGKDSMMRSMSSTATLAAISGGRLYLAHVGDSRAYLVREGKILQLTLDHSWGNEMIRQDRFSEEEISRHPKRTDLGRYIGQPMALEIDLGLRFLGSGESASHPAKSELTENGFVLQPGDVVVLCTDGLIKERRKVAGHFVEPEEIVKIAQRKRNAPADIANSLVSIALGRQTDDNVTVVVMEVAGGKTSRRISIPSMSKPRPLHIALALCGILLIALIGIVLTGPGSKPTPTPTPLPSRTITPTPPETLPPLGFAIADVVDGASEYQVSGQQIMQLQPGVTIPAGDGSWIRVNQGKAKLALGDKSAAYLDQSTTLNLNAVASYESQAGFTLLTLKQGRALVQSNGVIQIQADKVGFMTQLSGSGSIVGLVYDPDAANFRVDCLVGTCEISGVYGMHSLQGGQRFVVQEGQVQALLGVPYEEWISLAPDIVPTPTITPEATLTPMASESPSPFPTTRIEPLPSSNPTKEKPKPSKTPLPPTQQPTNTPEPPTNTPKPTEKPTDKPTIPAPTQ
jgi:protein phosphatase